MRQAPTPPGCAVEENLLIDAHKQEDPRMVSPNGSSDLVWDAKHLRIANDAAGIALWSWNVDTDEIALDQRAHGLWGVPKVKKPVTFERLSAKIHPEDLGRVRAAFTETRVMMGPYEIDFRIQPKGDAVRWISARGEGGDTGTVDKVMFGVFMDVTDRKQAEEARETLTWEMSHRIKNLFALASSLTSIAARSAATTSEMAADLRLRLGALGRAHDLVRPLPGKESKALLSDLLDILLAPYDLNGTSDGRIFISLPDVRVGEGSTTTLALVVHELATNAVKYGVLSQANGTLGVSCSVDGDVVTLLWTERGGPAVCAPNEPKGFGAKLIERSVSGQLGGSINYEWLADGVIVTLRMSKARIER